MFAVPIFLAGFAIICLGMARMNSQLAVENGLTLTAISHGAGLAVFGGCICQISLLYFK